MIALENDCSLNVMVEYWTLVPLLRILLNTISFAMKDKKTTRVIALEIACQSRELRQLLKSVSAPIQNNLFGTFVMRLLLLIISCVMLSGVDAQNLTFVKTNTETGVAQTNVSLEDMPDDPESTGNDSLLGVDSNKNGVRDDVERYIIQNYSHIPTIRDNLMRLAVGFQAMLKNTKNADRLHNAQYMQGIFDCLIIDPEFRLSMFKDLQRIQFNTVERLKKSAGGSEALVVMSEGCE